MRSLMITASTSERSNDTGLCVSIGIIAWNEEEGVESALQSLWQQRLFSQLRKRGLRTEIICIANGCTDQTAAIARRFFERSKTDPLGASVSCHFGHDPNGAGPIERATLLYSGADRAADTASARSGGVRRRIHQSAGVHRFSDGEHLSGSSGAGSRGCARFPKLSNDLRRIAQSK